MIKLALRGNGMPNVFSRTFLNLFGQTNPYLHIHKQGYSFSPGAFGKNIKTALICDCANEEKPHIPYDIMVLKDGFTGAVSDYRGTVIFSADGRPAFSLPSAGVVAISYGLSEKNSVTLSSIGPDSVTVTVQRELTGIRGQKIEPQDFIINERIKDKNISPLIASAIVLKLI